MEPSSVGQISHMICDRISAMPDWASANSVLLYLPKVGSNEIITHDLVDILQSRGARIGLPVVTGFERSTRNSGRIEVRALEDVCDVVVNRWGIPEPVNGPRVDVATIDLAIVPALGCGRNMYRIGHGFGYYDELLASMSCLKICPLPSGCLAESVPFEDHDVPVDYIVTEVETIGPVQAL